MKSGLSDIQENEDIEMMLQGMKPKPLADDLLARLCLAMNQVELEVKAQETIPQLTLHPKEVTRRQKPAKRTSQKWFNWAMAASVVFLASLSAIFVSNKQTNSSTIIANNVPSAPNVDTLTDRIHAKGGVGTPVVLDNAPYQDPDQQTFWLNNTAPHKLIKYTRLRVAQKIDENGKEVEVIVPEYTYKIEPAVAY